MSRILLIPLLFTLFINTAASESNDVSIELNKAEQRDNHCRIYLFTDNQTSHQFESLKLELVLFDLEDIIKSNLAINLAPLPSNKKSVKAFEVKNQDCNAFGSILVNNVLDCSTKNSEAIDCSSLMTLSSKNHINFSQ